MKKILFLFAAFTLLFSQSNFANSSEPCAACPSVSAFKTSNVTSTSATIYWNGLQSAKSYNVTVSQAKPIPLVAVIFEFKNVTTTSIDVTKLTAGTTYTYTITVNCTDGSTSELSKLGEFTTSGSNNNGGGTGSNNCPATSSFSAVALDSTSAVIKWNPVVNAVSYIVSVTPSGGKTITFPSTVPYVTATNLAAGSYTYTIQTVCKDGNGETSKKGEFTIKKSATPSTGCGQVIDFAAFVLDSTSASIKWTPVLGAVSYEISVSGPKGYKKIFTSTGNALTATSLPGSGTYEYKIRAICKEGPGAYSKTGIFTIKATNPTNNSGCGQVAFVGAVGAEKDTTIANIKWSNVPNAISYEIMITGPKGFVQNLTSTTTSLQATKLPGTGDYTVKVRAICKSGTGDWSKNNDFTISKPKTTGNTACATVKILSAVAKDSTTAVITWLPSLLVKSYEISVTAANGFAVVLSSTTAPVTVPNLPKNTTFKVTIRATCASGVSEWSKPFEFKTGKGTTVTTGTTGCGIPVGLTFKSYNSTTVQLFWSAVKGATSYDIEIEETALTGSTPVVVSYTSKINTIIVNDLKAGSSYTFKVRAICTSGTSEWSKKANFLVKDKLIDPNGGDTKTINNDNTSLVKAMFPNPATSEFSIALNGKEGQGNIFIINMLGSLVNTFEINAGETRNFDVSNLIPGYYFVKVTVNGKTETKRLMIAK